MATLTGDKVKISLLPPRPFLNTSYPLLEPHILKLYEISERGTILPTTVEEVAAESNIDDNLKSEHKEELDEAAIVFSTSKTHSVAYRGTLTKLFWELAEGMKIFFQEMPTNLLEKLIIKFGLTTSPINKVIDGFTITLSSLILITGHILDILNETTKSIEYGNKHLSTLRGGKAGKLLKSADFQDDLKIIGSVIPTTIATVYAVQGGLALILANLTTMRNTSTLELATKFDLDLLPTGSVLTTWRKLEKTSKEQQEGLHDILEKIRNTAQSA